MKNLNTKKIILASQSPRRRELLENACISFEIIPSKINEKNIKNNNPDQLVRTLSNLKAKNIAEQHPDTWVLGADTIVCINNTILEKPDSKTNAAHMLKALSNREHIVFTGFTLLCLDKNRTITKTVQTKVYFKRLSNQEINWYLDTDEYADKAGAYAIQGKGSFLVKKIIGSYTNVVGLPISEVIECLIAENIISFKNNY